jgi:thioredoxin reductase (NADPH)
LSKYAAEVLLVSRRKTLLEGEELVGVIDQTKNIILLLGTNVKEVKGTFKVTSIVLESGEKGVFETTVDGVFVEMGFDVSVDAFKGLVELDDKKQIIVDSRNETTVAGVFAAGDVTNTPFKQLVISAADGAKAALSAYEYIQRSAGRSAVVIDWHK